jgi:hypothetical protein
MLWSAIKGFKTTYFSSKEEKVANLQKAIDKFNDNGGYENNKVAVAISLFIGVGFYALFWIVMATMFSNAFLVGYCALMVAFSFVAYFRSLEVIKNNDTSAAGDKIAYFTMPANIVVVAIFIIMLLV